MFSCTKVWGHLLSEVLELLLAQELVVQEQIRALQVARLLRQPLDWVAAVAEDALIAIDERDGGAARRRVE